MLNHFATLIASRIREAGFADPVDLFVTHPGVSYGVLYRKVARPVPGTNHRDIPFMVFRLFHRDLYVRRLGERQFAQDALARSLAEHLKGGWGDGVARARAFANWMSLERDCEDQYERVWQSIEQLNPPRDWRPCGPDDPILVEAFARGWSSP